MPGLPSDATCAANCASKRAAVLPLNMRHRRSGETIVAVSMAARQSALARSSEAVLDPELAMTSVPGFAAAWITKG